MPVNMDHVADKNQSEFIRFASQYTLPLFVKQANLATTFSPGRLPESMYADPVRRQYPCHNAASTWLSALYFQEKKAEFHPKDQARIQDRIDKYAGYWQIKEAVSSIRQQWSELHKDAEAQLPDSSFAYVWVGEGGHKQRQLRLTNGMEVKAAAEWLHTYCDRVPYEQRHSMAKKILAKVAAFGVGLDKYAEFVDQQAGLGVCDPAEVVQMIEHRASLTKNAELKKQFLTMAATVQTVPRAALQPEMLVKLATTMDTLDRGLGLVGKYSELLPRPESVIFKATLTKIASGRIEHVATTSGRIYEKTAFRRLAVSDLQDLFGADFAGRVSSPLGEIDPEKMAEEVATLPRPDAELLDGLLADNGISPAMRKAASSGQRFNEDDMKIWAAAYAALD